MPLRAGAGFAPAGTERRQRRHRDLPARRLADRASARRGARPKCGALGFRVRDIAAPPLPRACPRAGRDTPDAAPGPRRTRSGDCTSATSSGRTQLMSVLERLAGDQQARPAARPPAARAWPRSSVELPLAEAGADPAGVVQPAVLVVVADMQRAEAGARCRPAASSRARSNSSRPWHFTLSQSLPRPPRYGASAACR